MSLVSELISNPLPVFRKGQFSSEEEILSAARNYINQRTEEAKQNLIYLLSQQITVAYLEGADRAAKEVKNYESVGIAGIDPVIDSLGPRLDEVFGRLSGELTGIIESGIRGGKSYVTVQKELSQVIKAGWGKTITFDSVGKTRKYVKISPDGSLEWAEKVITRRITLPTDTYAKTLSRTHIKAAYAHGRNQKYQESGYKGWEYISAADERTRPHHLALHGRTFIFGTPESDMALEVQKEYNCRCDQGAWFNDPEFDTDPKEASDERKQRAKKLLSEIPDSQKDGEAAKFLQEIIDHEDSSPATIQFKPAKTVKDAEKWVTEETPLIYSDYKGIDVAVANEMNESLAYHLNLEPSLDRLKYFGTCQIHAKLARERRYTSRLKRVQKGTVMWSWNVPGAEGIGANINECKNYAKLKKELEKCVADKFHPVKCDTVKSVIDHEFGHALDNVYDLSNKPNIRNIYMDWSRLSEEERDNTLCRYAWDNHSRSPIREFVAEAWSEYLNNPNPRSIAKQVGDIIKSTIEMH